MECGNICEDTTSPDIRGSGTAGAQGLQGYICLTFNMGTHVRVGAGWQGKLTKDRLEPSHKQGNCFSFKASLTYP